MNEIRIRFLFRPQIGRTLQQLVFLLLGQRSHRPFARFEPVLRMRMKLARQLDEIFRLERAASFVGGMIAPDTQRHPIARVGQTQLAIGLLFARQFRRRSFDLNMHARGHRVALRGPANFAQRHQLHVDLIATAPLDHIKRGIISAASITPHAIRAPEFPEGSVFRSSSFS